MKSRSFCLTKGGGRKLYSKYDKVKIQTLLAKKDIVSIMSDTTQNNTSKTQPEEISSVNVDADLMIDDLSYEDARDYVMRFLTAEKKTEKQLQEKQQAFNTWNERLAFAEKQGTPEQVELVKRELHALIRERDALSAEREALHRKNIILKEKLQIKAQGTDVETSSRAERLLADFDQLVNVEDYKLQEAMKEQEANDELAKLKAKIKNS